MKTSSGHSQEMYLTGKNLNFVFIHYQIFCKYPDISLIHLSYFKYCMKFPVHLPRPCEFKSVGSGIGEKKSIILGYRARVQNGVILVSYLDLFNNQVRG